MKRVFDRRALIVAVLALAAGGASLLAVMLALRIPLGAGVATLLEGLAGSAAARGALFGQSAVLLLSTLAVAFAWQVRLVNAGGEGQMLAGALAAAAAVQWLPGASALTWLLAVGAAMLAGAAAILPVLRVQRRGGDAALTGLLLNILLLVLAQAVLAQAVLAGPLPGWQPAGTGLLPLAALALALALAAAAALLLRYSVWGFKLQVVAANAAAARFAGIKVARLVTGAGVVSGLAGGLAGLLLVVLQQPGTAPPLLTGGLGYAGIAAAVIGGRSPLGWIGSALVLSWLLAAAAAGSRAGWWPVATGLLPVAVALLVWLAATARSRRRNEVVA